jgi:hypothetical protein
MGIAKVQAIKSKQEKERDLPHVAIKNIAMPMHVQPGPHSAIMEFCSLHMASSAIKM